jgi:hypothetical protein
MNLAGVFMLFGLTVIVAILVVVDRMRGRTPVSISDIRDLLEREYPDFRATQIEIGSDQGSALAFAADTSDVVLVLRLGDHLSGRRIDAARLRRVRTEAVSPLTEIVVDVPDVTFPGWRMRVEREVAERALSELERRGSTCRSGASRAASAPVNA